MNSDLNCTLELTQLTHCHQLTNVLLSVCKPPVDSFVRTTSSSSVLGCMWAGVIGVPVGSACDDGHKWAYNAGKAIHSLVPKKKQN